jgi:hypothetical protein
MVPKEFIDSNEVNCDIALCLIEGENIPISDYTLSSD